MEPRTISLGGGRVAPYPEPTSEAASTIGRANRRKDTRLEVELRRMLHALGLRFRKDLLLRLEGVRTHVDIAFTRPRLAVFVDGCFWHCCPVHGTMPKTNAAYWRPKFARNVERDGHVNGLLAEAGWAVSRIWEHEDPAAAASKVVAELVRLGHEPACRAELRARMA